MKRKFVKRSSFLDGMVVSTVASQQEGPGFDSGSRSFCVEFVCSSHSPKTCKLGVRLIDHSKLPVGVNVSLDVCLSLCVSPAINWRLVHGGLRLCLTMLR